LYVFIFTFFCPSIEVGIHQMNALESINLRKAYFKESFFGIIEY